MSGSFLVLTCFVIMSYNMLPTKETTCDPPGGVSRGMGPDT